jgi:hypothetical protein
MTVLLVASYMFVEQSTIITIVNYGCNTFITQTKDWAILYHLGYFRKIIVIFLKTAQRNFDFWAFGTIFWLLFGYSLGYILATLGNIFGYFWTIFGLFLATFGLFLATFWLLFVCFLGYYFHQYFNTFSHE